MGTNGTHLADAELGNESWDAVVIGAGVAGSLAALALAVCLPAARIALLERSRWPRDKVCGCCLNAGALRILGGFGVLDSIRGLGATAITRAQILRGSRAATLNIGEGLALDRATLDDCLVRAGIERGVVFCPGTSARVLPRDEGSELRSVRVQRANSTGLIRARLVLVADGLGGASLSGIPGFERRPRRDSWIGLGTILTGDDPPSGVVRLHVARHGYAGLARLPRSRLAVAAAIDPTFLRSFATPALALGTILASCGVESPPGLPGAQIHGTGRLTHRRCRVAEPGLLVLGDAASYIEPFTGEGMGWAMASAQRAAELGASHIGGSSSPETVANTWQREHDSTCRSRVRLCTLVRACLHSRVLAPAAVWALQSPVARRALERIGPWGRTREASAPRTRSPVREAIS